MISRLGLTFLSTTLLAVPVLAQTSPAPNPPPSPATSAPSPAAASGGIVTEQPSGQWRVSKLIGVDVYGSDNVKIGDINEILVDKSGAAQSVVIGVGGFLGIGEKNVAVSFGSLEWVNTAVSANAGGSNTAGSTSATGGMTTASSSTSSPASNAAAPSAPARSPEQTAAYNGYPNHAVLRMSKADLQKAPAFQYYADKQDSSTRSTGTGAGTPAAPRQ